MINRRRFAVRLPLMIFMTLGLLSASALAAIAGAAVEGTPGLVMRQERMMVTYAGPQVGMQFINMLDIVNTGEEDQSQIVLPLIAGHNELMFMGGPGPDEYVPLTTAVVIRQPIKAGETKSFRLMYSVPARLPAGFNRQILYKTEKMMVYMPRTDLLGNISGLVDGGIRDLGSGPVQTYVNQAPLDPTPTFSLQFRANVRELAPYFARMVALLAIPLVGLVAIGVRSARMRRRARLAAAQPTVAQPGVAGKKGR